MRWFLGRFSDPGASNHTPSLADFTTITPEPKFSVHRFSIQTPVDVNCSQKKVAYVRAAPPLPHDEHGRGKSGAGWSVTMPRAVGERSLATSIGNSRGGLGSATAID
jgi:hypothetical protein